MTYVRTLHTQYWILQASDEYINELDESRIAKDGKRGRLINRKRQMERFVQFKTDVREWAARNGFKMPHGYFAMWFYVPMPKSWKGKKRRQMLYTMHQSTPDLDNNIKGFLDAVLPKKKRVIGEKGSDDRRIFCYAAFKIWVEPKEACMKIIEYSEVEFMGQFNSGLPY